MTRRLMLAITFVAIIATVCSGLTNYFTNPSFENGLNGWYKENNLCHVTDEMAHTGKYSLHCNSTAGKRGFVAQWKTPFPGLRYNISGYFKIKNISSSGYIMLSAEKGSYGVWSKVTCPNKAAPPCMDDWFYFSDVTTMYLSPNSLSYTMQLTSQDETEFWVDDLSFEMVTTDSLLRAAEVRSWRQEVFEDKVEVLADLLISGTCFENGTYLSLILEVVENSTGTIVDTVTEYTIQHRVENFLAVFIYDPTPLTEGFYIMRVTMTNSLFEKTETVETNMHKLGQKRTYKRYIDNYNRVIDDGKPFFPLGIYTWTMYRNETEIKTITELPFNLVLTPMWDNENVDYIYSHSNGQLRVIRGVDFVKCYTLSESIEKAAALAKERAESWSKQEGFFGYYLVDEPTLGCLPNMRAATLAIRETDYDHFIYPVINRYYELHKLKEGFDVTGVDDYPMQHYDDLRSVVVVARQGRARLMNSRAMWNVPQFFDWTYHDLPNESPPTEEQLRHMTYQFIVGGGMGLMYFHYSTMQELSWKNNMTKEWEKMKNVVTELHDNYIPIIMSGLDINPGLVLPVENDYMCYVRFFRYNGYDYALVVNAWDTREITCTFWVTNTTKSIEKLTGSSEIKRDGTKVSFKMPKMDIVWLKMKDTKWDDYHTHMNGTVEKVKTTPESGSGSTYGPESGSGSIHGPGSGSGSTHGPGSGSGSTHGPGSGSGSTHGSGGNFSSNIAPSFLFIILLCFFIGVLIEK